jgi:23S rRNA (pseudouridine1915-N3)-methyltransferase
VKIKVAWIGKTKEPAIDSLTTEYLKRISRYIEVEGLILKDESQLAPLANGIPNKKASNKERYKLILLDSHGRQLSSEDLAEFVDREQLAAQPLLFAIGGSAGFSRATLEAAYTSISLGKMTLPHELARVVLLEQLYRAFTILKNHPYHLGH